MTQGTTRSDAWNDVEEDEGYYASFGPDVADMVFSSGTAGMAPAAPGRVRQYSRTSYDCRFPRLRLIREQGHYFCGRDLAWHGLHVFLGNLGLQPRCLPR